MSDGEATPTTPAAAPAAITLPCPWPLTQTHTPDDKGVRPGPKKRAWLFDFGDIRLGLPPDGTTEIGVMEFWTYEPHPGGRPLPSPASSSAKVLRKFQQYRQTEIVKYLSEPIPMLDGRHPTGGFQVAVVPCDFQLLPKLGIDRLDAINAALGLPGHSHHYASVQCGAIGMFLLEDKTWLFARPRAPDFSMITTMLRYDPATNITRGLFYTDAAFPRFKNVVSEFEACPHPLLLPTLALELTLQENVNHLARHHTTLEQMEGSTGYGLLDERRGDHVQDYRTLVKELSKARSGVHLALSTLKSTQWTAEFILRKMDWVDERLAPGTRESLREASRILTERTEFVLSTIQHALVRGGVKERVEGQHSTLFNLITQNDSLLSTSIAQDSREIAAASKRDSSSMKILAFLTTFFLPGTFVATFFSMPLFDWSETSISHVANKHFWVFWALAAPLTVTVMAGVVAWAIWNSKNTKATERKARENFSQAIADEAQQLKRAATMRTMNVPA
ncbi:uncharacterized protein BJX67DRAFT_229958 [Aspergillus lucknowensis]|uniref:Uncharacterized protein n=1 Tax=Aspergillus lucknowensis TaxID=176173 RepID=A0ABR4LKZ6_9EURO